MSHVALYHNPSLQSYPADPPFSPSEAHPEYPFTHRSKTPNLVYEGVRSLLRDLHLDDEHFGRPSWNPLGGMIRPGQTVLLKPNFVMDVHRLGYDVFSIFTHASVLRAMMDYATIALRGEGRIVIGDAPLQSCNLPNLLRINRIQELVDFYQTHRQVVVRVEDFRREVTVRDSDNLVLERSFRGEQGYRIVDLGEDSMLSTISAGHRNYRVTNYDVSVMARHHDQRANQYFIAQTVLDADAVINIPKLKTHRKAGITGALKNVVGINCHKDCLPHHRFGSQEEGFDEYLHRSLLKKATTLLVEKQDISTDRFTQKAIGYPIKLLSLVSSLVERDPFREGSWYGNDTLWRTILDLNRIFLYADKEGRLSSTQARKVLHIVDAVIAGDREGPIEPTPKACGVLIGGAHAPAVDAAGATLMGFDFRKIPTVAHSFADHRYPLVTPPPDEVLVSRSGRTSTLDQLREDVNLRFHPPSGWQGTVEVNGHRAQ